MTTHIEAIARAMCEADGLDWDALEVRPSPSEMK